MSDNMYEGASLLKSVTIGSEVLQPYLPGERLVKAVQLAQILKRPLLLKGEPGCGKSRLAEAVAYELFKEGYKDHYFEWPIKSTSKAQDGLYVINHLQRLRDANIKENGESKDLTIKLGGDYLELGPLGNAFLKSKELGIKTVVLIDEIDKANIDFPNDLLFELDKMKFSIPDAKDENGKPLTIEANKERRPLVIITSNDEKPLPPAFLRRCLFHYIDFNEVKLIDIVKANFSELSEDFLRDSVDKFKNWREKIALKGTSNKNISTSELLDWLRIIDHYNKQPQEKQPQEKITIANDQLPPFYEALLKDVESIKVFATSKVQ